MVDVEYVSTFGGFVSLEEVKNTKSLEHMVLVKRGRLSVQPVTKNEFDAIVKKGKKK